MDAQNDDFQDRVEDSLERIQDEIDACIDRFQVAKLLSEVDNDENRQKAADELCKLKCFITNCVVLIESVQFCWTAFIMLNHLQA